MSNLINFLNPRLKTSVKSNAPCKDGFTASNLIADDEELLKRGFMCSSACKPPVEVIFDFFKAVDIRAIKLWPSIGTLSSTAFELHVRQDGKWVRVAFVKDLPHGLEFVTFCYQSDVNSQTTCNATGQPLSRKVSFLKGAHKILPSISSVKVIIRATGNCPPVLRKVELWGLPARLVDKAKGAVSVPYGQRDDASKGKLGQRSSPRPIPQLKKHSMLFLPEEFLDSITWELMIQPTVLPSGKVVDQTTIDKHNAAEAKWGRQPSDPFTGLNYNNESKPIVNLELKTRIEAFLLKYSGDFELPHSRGSKRLHRRTHQSDPICPASSTSMVPTKVYRMQKLKRMATAKGTSLSAASGKQPSAKKAKLSHQDTTASTSSPSMNQTFKQVLLKTTISGQMTGSCINCRSAQFRYKIRTCHHLVCQDCLVHLLKEQLCVCKIAFQDADVDRHQKLYR
ncbi:RING finger protein 37-like [Drosophila serrata]|uniref:RING finger protein 37-like n=1 Tax=Drosophila serrata TaxID=7274 RepID=UPI000A1D22A0|nr:RING finger protein 37-like [Drosophila serrata]